MRSNSGLTLVEVLVATAILAAVMAITMQVFFSSTDIAFKGSISGDLDRRGRDLIDACKKQFLPALFNDASGPTVGGTSSMGIPTDTYNTEIRFKLPVNRQADGTMQYGYPTRMDLDESANVGRACIIRFEAETLLLESSSSLTASQPAETWGGFPSLPTLSTRVADIDINKDGDLTDTYVWGYVRRYVVSSAGNMDFRETLTDRALLRVSSGQYYGHLTTDSDTTKLFYLVPTTGSTPPATAADAKEVGISVMFGAFDDEGKNFIVRTHGETVKFRNAQ